MTELEKLIEQRKELDKRIRDLQYPKYEVDGARMFVKLTSRSIAFGNTYSWIVTLENIGGKTTAYKEMIRANTKEEAIEELEILIDVLANLYQEVTKKEKEDE